MSRWGGLFDIAQKRDDLKIKEERTLAPDFWNNPSDAEIYLKKVSALKYWVKGFSEIESALEDLVVLYDFSKEDDTITNEVDEHYNALFRELLTYMMGDPRTIGACTHLLFMAKNLERIGDHATNIAETVHYEITGEEIMGERPRALPNPDDDASTPNLITDTN